MKTAEAKPAVVRARAAKNQSKIVVRKIDPSFVITHRVGLSRAPETYAMFAKKCDGCVKVVLDPAA